MINTSYLSLIGNTPMVWLRKFSPENGGQIYAKLEWFNPGGSLKDRIVQSMFESAIKTGAISSEKQLVEATSGNTGIALAMVGAYYGVKVTIIMPESASREKQKAIEMFGASLILTPEEDGTAGAIRMKESILKQSKSKFVSLDQFSNAENPRAHREGTALEILKQTNGKLDALVVGIGTGGTATGCSAVLKRYDPRIRVFGVAPEKGITVPGLRNPNDDMPSKVLDDSAIDEIKWIGKSEQSELGGIVKEVAEREAMLIGWSSAAVLLVSRNLAMSMKSDSTIISVLPDSGFRYL
ncbi:MAG: PLP-dependent cysteine synthase family protein [Nitrososphaerota archaeon]|jgi:cysteine synthase|nr:PLP-dependent cysteine synthase family protein [Nitrososphaerota archaeon]MDG6928184.1 PLP-dependent cysteine synthase family protein [Nitrososphaerota archaeon]MDG6930802.1 PLP-dependent cysteine synthase family protein [Nitrososphaerota archaeon]MDG6932969.1 PLP-dependent cysteine synthase family protein [Nitrososphaerota archaeon]MDG6936304.1 PLP-dependent cysteine synthase family protein [Nitrososphaerota archaeon]